MPALPCPWACYVEGNLIRVAAPARDVEIFFSQPPTLPPGCTSPPLVDRQPGPMTAQSLGCHRVKVGSDPSSKARPAPGFATEYSSLRALGPSRVAGGGADPRPAAPPQEADPSPAPRASRASHLPLTADSGAGSETVGMRRCGILLASNPVRRAAWLRSSVHGTGRDGGRAGAGPRRQAGSPWVWHPQGPAPARFAS